MGDVLSWNNRDWNGVRQPNDHSFVSRIHKTTNSGKESNMKKLALLTTLSVAFALPAVCGCGGGGDNAVIEAPDEVLEEEPAMEGMTDEEYDAAMDADEAE